MGSLLTTESPPLPDEYEKLSPKYVESTKVRTKQKKSPKYVELAKVQTQQNKRTKQKKNHLNTLN